MFYFVKILFKFMGKKRLLFAFGVLCTVLSAAVSVFPSKAVALAVDSVMSGSYNSKHILMLMAICMGLILLKLALRYSARISYENATQCQLISLRGELYRNLNRLDSSYFGSNTTGDILTQLVSDTDVVRAFFALHMHNAIDAVVLFIATFAMLVSINLKLTLLLMVLLPFILFFNLLLLRKMKPYHSASRDALAEMSNTAAENIGGNKTVRAFAREEYEKEKMHECVEKSKRTTLRTAKAYIKFAVPEEFFSALLPVAALIFGGYYVMKGEITVGDLTVFAGLTGTLAMLSLTTGAILNETQRFFASCEKIHPLLCAQPNIENLPGAVDITEFLDKIEYRNVTLEIDGKSIISNVSFTINKGEFIGIMGPTGSGKTMLLAMLQRFYDPTRGEILVDGVNIKKYTLQSLRKLFSFSYQDVFLHSNTVEGNIAFSNPDMDSAKVQEYAEIAQADEFISKMPQGYETVIGERGVGVSGGQRQRISLARALAAERSVLILDDTTSAVDFETEKYIQENLRKISGITKVVVAQRVSAVRDCTKIIVLKNGKIDQMGTFGELKNDSYFGKIYKIQNDSF